MPSVIDNIKKFFGAKTSEPREKGLWLVDSIMKVNDLKREDLHDPDTYIPEQNIKAILEPLPEQAIKEPDVIGKTDSLAGPEKGAAPVEKREILQGLKDSPATSEAGKNPVVTQINPVAPIKPPM